MGWVLNATQRPLYSPRKYPVPIVQEAECASEPIWKEAEYLPSPEGHHRTVQSAASRYTDWTIKAYLHSQIIEQQRILSL